MESALTPAAGNDALNGEFRAGACTRQRLGLLVMGLLAAITWALSHHYKGLFHDAQLYTLQALAHLSPGSLSHDVFLRFGSQDEYTIFSPLYALVIHWIGTEPAAAVLTLTLQLGLLLGAAVLARTVVPGTPALVGIALLIAIPGSYGAAEVFTCIESFVTPRMGAEALVLGSLAAALHGRWRLAWAFLAAAILLHPVMAAAGLCGLLCLYIAIPRPKLAAALLAPAGATLLLIAVFAPVDGRFGHFDATWLTLVEYRSPYLLLQSWTLEDWGRTAVYLATLAVGATALPADAAEGPSSGRARKLARVALLTGLGGLALTLVACDRLHLVLLTQLQPWRWLWLAVVVAALLLPAIALACWQAGLPGKTAVALLVAAWIFGSGVFALVTAAFAVVTPLMKRLRPGEARLVLYGACALLLIAASLRMAGNLLFSEVSYIDPQIPLWIRRATSFVHDGTVPLAVILFAALLASRPRGMPGLIALATVSAATLLALLPEVWAGWSQQRFPPALQEHFAPWRALIPPGREVFWSESAPETWVLLERPSYLSVVQTSGMVFSRAAALEMQRRAIALSAVVPPGAFLSFSGGGAGIGPTREQLERACATGEFDFVVSGVALSWAPLATLPREVWHSSGGLRLYRCSDRTGV
jgi:hypothetical protein